MDAAIIVPPRSIAMPSEAAETAPTQRHRHLRAIAEHGRMAWQAASGYTKRARVETAMSRFKRVIADALRSHTDERRATKVEVVVHVLDHMLDLGRPNSVRIARSAIGDGGSTSNSLVHATTLDRSFDSPHR